MTKLYQVKKDPDQFGTFLATNSVGDTVLEMKGNGGTVKSFKPGEIELVVPYTVRLRALSANSQIDMVVPKGSVDIGDIVAWAHQLYLVSMLDTKSQNASPMKKFRVHKGVTVDMGGNENEDE